MDNFNFKEKYFPILWKEPAYTMAEFINTLTVKKIQSRAATNLHYFDILFYN